MMIIYLWFSTSWQNVSFWHLKYCSSEVIESTASFHAGQKVDATNLWNDLKSECISHQDVLKRLFVFCVQAIKASNWNLQLQQQQQQQQNPSSSNLSFLVYPSSFDVSMFGTLKVTPLRHVKDQATLAEIFSKETKRVAREIRKKKTSIS